jgi:type II secretion system protein N
MQRALKITGWTFAFLLLLALGVRVTFPTDALARMLEVRLSDALGATEVKIGELSLLGLIPGGVELEEVEIAFKDVALKTETPGKDRMVGRVMQAERLAIEASLGGLLGGEVDATFEGELMGGRVEGGRLVVPKEGLAELRVATISDLNLGSERLFAATTGFDVRGVLSGSIDLQVPVSSPEGKLTPDMGGLAGTIELAIADTRIADPVVERNQMRIALTDVTLGRVGLKARAGDGKPGASGAEGDARRATGPTVLHLEELSATGPDLQISIGQRAAITFVPGRPMSQAALRAHFAILIDEAYVTREVDDPKTPGKKARPNGALKLILEDLGRKGHLADGQFGLTLSGPISKPSITTEKPRVRVGASASGGRRMNVDASEGGGEAEGGAAQPGADAGRPGRPAINRPAVGGGRPITAAPLGGGLRGSLSAGRPSLPPPSIPTPPPSPAEMPEPAPEAESEGPTDDPTEGLDDPATGGDDPMASPDEPTGE